MSPSQQSIVTNTAIVVVVGSAITMTAARAFNLSSLFRYRPGKVWKFTPQKGAWGAQVNRPTAGARTSSKLPRGEHDIQLYSLGTPNGMKVTCLLEELNLKYGIEYDGWRISIGGGDLEQFTTGFVEANPNSKIPAMFHYAAKDDVKPTRIFESASIMMYLCETYDTENVFLPPIGDPDRQECLSWLFWVQGSAPFLGGGFGHFYNYAPVKIKYAIDRYSLETKRQLDVLERHLAGIVNEEMGEERSKYCGGPYLCGDRMTLADLCCYPWYGRLVQGKLYENSAEFLQVQEYPHVIEWASRMSDRKGVQRGCVVNRSSGENMLQERHSAKDFDKIKF